jgi:hypothetical protein
MCACPSSYRDTKAVIDPLQYRTPRFSDITAKWHISRQQSHLLKCYFIKLATISSSCLQGRARKANERWSRLLATRKTAEDFETKKALMNEALVLQPSVLPVITSYSTTLELMMGYSWLSAHRQAVPRPSSCFWWNLPRPMSCQQPSTHAHLDPTMEKNRRVGTTSWQHWI